MFHKLPILSVVLLLFPQLVSADSWIPPDISKYYSENKDYYFEVIPRDLVNKEDSTNYCKGTLYQAKKAVTDEIVWTKQLTNSVSPGRVLVSDYGDYVITFDNWGSVGYGDNVVVIYGKSGALIKKYSLEDILQEDLHKFIQLSVSSRWWGGNHHINEKDKILILNLLSKKESTIKEIQIYLATGEIISN